MATRTALWSFLALCLVPPLYAQAEEPPVQFGPWRTDRPDVVTVCEAIAEGLTASPLIESCLEGRDLHLRNRAGTTLSYEVLDAVFAAQGITLSIWRGSDGSPSFLAVDQRSSRTNSPRPDDLEWEVFRLRPQSLAAILQSLRGRARQDMIWGRPRVKARAIGSEFLLLSGPPAAVRAVGDWIESTGEPLPQHIARPLWQDALVAPFEFPLRWGTLLAALAVSIFWRARRVIRRERSETAGP